MSDFVYILNAMENAACHSNPHDHGYGQKRSAAISYVEKLEAERDELLSAMKRLVEWDRSHPQTESYKSELDCIIEGYLKLIAKHSKKS